MNEEIKMAVLRVRATGRTNMFDIPAVQRIAYELEEYGLVLWLEERENRSTYVHFIMTGEAGDQDG